MGVWSVSLNDSIELPAHAREFLLRRAKIESFDPKRHSFYHFDPMIQFVAVVLTGYIRNTFYMSAGEIMRESVPLHRKASSEDPNFHFEAISRSRESGMKDQVLIGLAVWTKHPMREEKFRGLAELLASFPPSQIIRKFIKMKRGKAVGGLGSFEKRVLREVYRIWEERGRIPYYFAKYRRYMHQLVNLIHVKVPECEFSYLSNPTSYEGDSEYLRAISEFLRTKDLNKLPDGAPFELVRSNLRREEWSPVILRKCDLTPSTAIMQAVSLYERLGEEFLPFLHRAVHSRVTSDRILKAAMAAYCGGLKRLTSVLSEVYSRKLSYLKDHLPKGRVCAIVDASASMSPISSHGLFTNAITLLSSVAWRVDRLIFFSDYAKDEYPELLRSFEGVLELIRIGRTGYSGGTNIAAGLKVAEESDEPVIMLITDEQANINELDKKEMDMIKRISRERFLVLVNPSPYPVHIIEPERNIAYLPAANPEGLISALKLNILNMLAKSRKSAYEIFVELAGEG